MIFSVGSCVKVYRFFISKKYPELITDNRPFLLLTSDTAKLVGTEREIIKCAQFLHHSPMGYQLYRLNIKDILLAKKHLLKTLTDDYLVSRQTKDSTIKQLDFNYNFGDFEYFKGEYLNQDVVVYEGPISVKPDSLFEVSMWGTGSKNFWGSAAFRIEQFDSNHVRIEERFSSENQDIDIVKKWYLLRLQTKKLHPKNTFRITASGHRYQYCNLLIRNPADTITTIDEKTNWWFVNNRTFKVRQK